MQEVVGKMMELRIAEKETRHVVGLSRFEQIPAAAFDLTIPGVVDVGVDYEVDVYVDANGNGSYDDPSKGAGDFGFRIPVSSTATGLTLTVDARLVDRKVDVGAP